MREKYNRSDENCRPNKYIEITVVGHKVPGRMEKKNE